MGRIPASDTISAGEHLELINLATIVPTFTKLEILAEGKHTRGDILQAVGMSDYDSCPMPVHVATSVVQTEVLCTSLVSISPQLPPRVNLIGDLQWWYATNPMLENLQARERNLHLRLLLILPCALEVPHPCE